MQINEPIIELIKNIELIAGVDEVGRGPLAGAVVAAAVILDPTKPIAGLADSKLLSPKTRERLAVQIQERCLAWAVGRAEVEEIDAINILQASLLAMERALAGLKVQPTRVLVDGIHRPRLPFAASLLSFPFSSPSLSACEVLCEAVIGGDRLIPAISAASIIAKVIRDKEMVEWDKIYPAYGFAKHKGYGTKQHLLALQQHGATPLHRRSFAPVKNLTT